MRLEDWRNLPCFGAFLQFGLASCEINHAQPEAGMLLCCFLSMETVISLTFGDCTNPDGHSCMSLKEGHSSKSQTATLGGRVKICNKAWAAKNA